MEVETCEIENSVFTKCWNDDTTSTNLNLTTYNIPYTSGEDLDDQSWFGIFGSYSGGGYVIDLPLNKSKAIQILSDLKQQDFIDGATKAFFIDFNFINPSTILHTVARLAIEMPTAGK